MSSDFYSPFPVNILRGITPTASTWDTDPTNLANCTDGNFTTVTGTGSKVLGAAGYYGNLTFDMDAIKTVMIGMKLGVWSTASSVVTNVAFSDDDITYTYDVNLAENLTTAAELIRFHRNIIGSGRYIKLRFYVNAAATAYAKIYEVMAYELGI